jgi:hypothetical protein
MWNHEYVESIRKALDEIGRVCPRCVLRLAGVKNSREHKSAEPAENETNGQESSNVSFQLRTIVTADI